MADTVKILKWSAISSVSLLFIGVVGYTWWKQDDIRSGNLHLTTIKAPNTPVKVRPDDPGGREFPNRDKRVFDLLAMDEEDAAKQEVQANKDGLEQVEALPAEITAPETIVQMPTKQLAEEEQSWTDKIAAKHNTKTEEAKKDPIAAVLSDQGDWGVQLASFLNEADAKRAAGQYANRFEDLLGGLNSFIQEADLEQRGVRYRVRFVGLENSEAARALCTRLKSRNQGCLHVRR